MNYGMLCARKNLRKLKLVKNGIYKLKNIFQEKRQSFYGKFEKKALGRFNTIIRLPIVDAACVLVKSVERN